MQTSVDYTWKQTLRMPEFWLLYFIHFLISFGGLMTLGNLSEIARSLHVESTTIVGVSIVAFAATANGIASTASRIIWGTASDRIGRENTMLIVFILEAGSIFAVTQIAGNPILFVIMFPLVFLGYGQLNTLLSATTGDLFGSRAMHPPISAWSTPARARPRCSRAGVRRRSRPHSQGHSPRPTTSPPAATCSRRCLPSSRSSRSRA